MTEKLYRIIIFVQDGETLYECDKLYHGEENYETVYSNCDGEAVIDYLKDYDDTEFDPLYDIEVGEPHIVRGNYTDSVYQKDGYFLRYNSSIGGVYMLYREANEVEIEYYKESK